MNATCGTCQLEKFPGLFRGRGGKDQSFTFNPRKDQWMGPRKHYLSIELLISNMASRWQSPLVRTYQDLRINPFIHSIDLLSHTWWI